MKLSNVNWYEVYKKWVSNTAFFEYLFKSTPFVSAKYLEDFEINLDKKYLLPNSIVKVLKEKMDKDRILILDTDTDLGMKAALTINNELSAAPILSYNFLFHPYGIVGSKELIQDIVNVSMRMEHITPKTYVFILDNNRYIDNIDLSNPMIFNNQYEITEEELPDIEALNKLGIKEIAYLHTKTIKADITAYLEYVKNNNFHVDIINLGD